MLSEGLVDADRHHFEAATVVLHSLLNSESARAENKRRQSVVEWIDDLSTKLLGIRALPVGASLSNTSPLISNEEVELSLFFDKNDSPRGDRWYLTLYEALCNHSNEDKDKMNAWRLPASTIVERISFITVAQKLEALVDGSIVSIKPNDISSLVFASLLDDFDKAVGCKSLLKRSILLIKAWCIYEAPLIRLNDAKGDHTGAFNSCLCMLRCDKVIEVMVMALCSSNILNDSSSDPIQEPFKVLMRFLDIFSRFDWINYAVSVTGLIVQPSSTLQSELRDEDFGTETDSPMYSAVPSPLSSTSCESEACTYPVVGSSNLSAKLSAIVDKYRVRLSLTSLSDDIDDGPHRLHSADTDAEDNSCYDEKERQRRDRRLFACQNHVVGFPRMRSDMEHIAPGGSLKGMQALLSESDIKLASLSRTGVIVLDPTKGYSNLCATNSTAMTHDGHLRQQECLKSIFASGLSTMRQSLDATDIALKDSCPEELSSASGETDTIREISTNTAEVAKIVTQIFPVMSQMTALKESMMAYTTGTGIDESVFPSLVQSSSVHLSSTLRYAENAITSKIKTAPTVINDQAGASYLRCTGTNLENETVSSMMTISSQPKPSDIVDALGLSEISISKSFSSFESDIGLSNDYSISLSGDQSSDAAIRFLSAYSPTELTPSVSYDAYLSRPQGIGPGCVVHSDHIGSDSFNSVGVSYQRNSTQQFLQPGSKILSTSSSDQTKSPIVSGEVYHQHQKTLMRHTQNVPQVVSGHSQSAPCLVRPPVVAMPPRVGESQQDATSNVSAHLPIKVQVPPTVPTVSGKVLSPPFIQPFVVKEMQVWVPGKFGTSNSNPATAKIPTQATQLAKPVGYPKVAYTSNGGHMIGGGQVQVQGGLAGRYSPVLQGTSPRATNNYMYLPPEEEYDVTWIDQPEEGHSRIKANRIALAGHLQMQGQLRDRQRLNNMPSDHMSSSQYAGSGSVSGSSRSIGRSPSSDLDSASPHGHSPPSSASSPFGSMQVKRSPSNSLILGQQSSRLNYGISSVVGSRSAISPMLRDSSPPGFNAPKNAFDSNDYDNWSLSNQQHLNQQTLHMSSEASPFAGLTGGNARPFGLADQHAEQRRALLMQQQQQLQAQQRMIQMESEKSRNALSASQKEKSEAQLPSFLRDL